MKPTKKKPVKRASTCKDCLQVPTVAKSATVEPMVQFRWTESTFGDTYITGSQILPRQERYVLIAEKDLPRVVEAMAKAHSKILIEDIYGGERTIAIAQLRAIGIEVESHGWTDMHSKNTGDPR